MGHNLWAIDCCKFDLLNVFTLVLNCYEQSAVIIRLGIEGLLVSLNTGGVTVFCP